MDPSPTPWPATLQPWRPSLKAALLPALVAVLLNALKPVHIDDACFILFSKHIAHHPLDPFGFRLLWDQSPQPASEVMAPPVVLYWLAAAVRLFGSNVVAWKLWFTPMVLLFAACLHRLLHRFARGVETPFVWMTLLSPAFVPGINLMLDVPALGIGLFSLVLFLEAGDRGSFGQAIAAGVVAGIGAETKYTTLILPAVMIVAGWLRRRPAPAFAAAGIAWAMFLAWEGMTWARYGTCHLVHTMFHYPYTARKVDLILPFFMHLGALAPALLLTGLAIVPVRSWILWTVALILAAAFPGAGLLPEPVSAVLDDRTYDVLRRSLPETIFLLAGLATAGVTAFYGCRIGLRRWESLFSRFPDRLLAAWFFMELAAYVVLSPYPAARRLMPIVVVMSLLLGRLAALAPSGTFRKSRLILLACASAAFGLCFLIVDEREARAQKTGIEQTSRWIEEQSQGGAVWYAGHWGFQHYAEEKQMTPLVANASAVRRGDWLVLPDLRIAQQNVAFTSKQATPVHRIELDDALPFHTIPAYYAGDAPVERRRGPRLSIRIFRAQEDFVPGRR